MTNKKYINENVDEDDERYFDFAKYNADFMKSHYKRVTVLVPLSEIELLDHLDNNKPVSSYILNLIKEDYKKSQQL